MLLLIFDWNSSLIPLVVCNYMHYVKHILMPNEKVLYDSHVHPRVLVPGMLILGVAAFLLHVSSHTGHWHSILLSFAYYLAVHFPWTAGLYRLLVNWQTIAPDIALEIKVVGLFVAAYGFSRLAQGLVLIQTTELVVTDHRIIAKVGLMTVVTQEMDRRRVAGVTIDQSLWGRIMGYGDIYIRGFTSTIGGLPIMVHPHRLQQFINSPI
jgi:hypothetical protein